MRQLNQFINEIACLSIIIFFMGCSPKVNEFDKYDSLIWPAMLAYEEDNYQNGLTDFEKAFEFIPHESENDIFYAAAAALEYNKKQN